MTCTKNCTYKIDGELQPQLRLWKCDPISTSYFKMPQLLNFFFNHELLSNWKRIQIINLKSLNKTYLRSFEVKNFQNALDIEI